jgi:hypothetical protein
MTNNNSVGREAVLEISIRNIYDNFCQYLFEVASAGEESDGSNPFESASEYLYLIASCDIYGMRTMFEKEEVTFFIPEYEVSIEEVRIYDDTKEGVEPKLLMVLVRDELMYDL